MEEDQIFSAMEDKMQKNTLRELFTVKVFDSALPLSLLNIGAP